MTIFGYGNYSAAFPGTAPHYGTPLDTAMNYVFAVILVVVATIGVILNSLVFYYNNRQSKLTLVSFLFQLLSAIDFQFSVRTIWAVYCLMSPTQLELFERNTTVWDRISSVYQNGLYGASISVTCLLCFVRFLKIRAPFWANGNHRCLNMLAGCLLAGVSLTNVVLPTVYMCDTRRHLVLYSPILSVIPVSANEHFALHVLIRVVLPIYFNQLLSLIFSLLTIHCLNTSMGQVLSHVKRHSIMTIVWLNVSNLVWLVFSGLDFAALVVSPISKRTPEDYSLTYLTFFVWVMLQPIISAYNPIIVCSRTAGIKKLVGYWWRTGKLARTRELIALNQQSDSSDRLPQRLHPMLHAKRYEHT